MQQRGRLLRFAYNSVLSHDVADEEILRIFQRAWKYNQANDITGVIEFRGGRFSQVIEGRIGVITPLSAAILTDWRHDTIEITAFEQIGARSFDRWMVDSDLRVPLPEQPQVAAEEASGNVIFSDRFKGPGLARPQLRGPENNSFKPRSDS